VASFKQLLTGLIEQLPGHPNKAPDDQGSGASAPRPRDDERDQKLATTKQTELTGNRVVPTSDQPPAPIEIERERAPEAATHSAHPDEREAIVQVFRDWKRLVSIVGHALPMHVWLEALDDVGSGLCQPEDGELYKRVSSCLHAQRLADALGPDFEFRGALLEMAMGDRDADAEVLRKSEEAFVLRASKPPKRKSKTARRNSAPARV
jgi:hypothetical protein